MLGSSRSSLSRGTAAARAGCYRGDGATTTDRGIAGSPAESFSPSHGIEIRHCRVCSRDSISVGRSDTGSPLRRNGRCRSRSYGSAGGRPWEVTTSSVAVPVGLCRRIAVLRPPIGGLVLGPLHHRATVHFDQLVDQSRGRCSGAGHDGGAGAVRVDRFGRERRDRILVEVAGDHDPSLHGAEGVEQLPGLCREHRQVTGVDPDGAQARVRPPRSRCGCPELMSYVSTSRVVCLPSAATWEANAADSSSCSSVNACAAVPVVGTPCRRPASRFEVDAKPAR